MKKLYYVGNSKYCYNYYEMLSIAVSHFKLGFDVVTNCPIGKTLYDSRLDICKGFKSYFDNNYKVDSKMTTLKNVCSKRKLSENTVFILDTENTNSYDFFNDDFDFDVQKLKDTGKFDYVCLVDFDDDNHGKAIYNEFLFEVIDLKSKEKELNSQKTILLTCCDDEFRVFGDEIKPLYSDYGVSVIDFRCIRDGEIDLFFDKADKNEMLSLIKEAVEEYGAAVSSIAFDEDYEDGVHIILDFSFKRFVHRRKYSGESYLGIMGFEGSYFTAYYLSNAFKFLDDVFGFSPELLASIAEKDISDFYCYSEYTHDEP